MCEVTELLDNIAKPMWHVHAEQHNWLGVTPAGEFIYLTNEQAMQITVGELIFAGHSIDNKVEIIKLRDGTTLVLPRNGGKYSEAAQNYGFGSVAKIFDDYNL